MLKSKPIAEDIERGIPFCVPNTILTQLVCFWAAVCISDFRTAHLTPDKDVSDFPAEILL